MPSPESGPRPGSEGQVKERPPIKPQTPPKGNSGKGSPGGSEPQR